MVKMVQFGVHSRGETSIDDSHEEDSIDMNTALLLNSQNIPAQTGRGKAYSVRDKQLTVKMERNLPSIILSSVWPQSQSSETVVVQCHRSWEK